MSALDGLKRVPKREFQIFLGKERVRSRVKRDRCMIVEPPMVRYFRDIDHPIAVISEEWMGPNGEKADDDRFWEYYIS